MTTSIYVLRCPITEQIRYVGKTLYPLRRFKRHLSSAKYKRNHTEKWINNLLAHKLIPIFSVIETCDESSWEESEKFYISYLKSLGFNLTNHTEGGEGTLGYKPSKETIEKLKISHIGHKRTKESIERSNRGKYKPVLQYDKNRNLIKEREAAIIAERHGGFNRKTISRCCKGEIKTHKGFIWRFKI